MVDAAYEDLYEFLRPGVRENECVGLVSKTLYDLGSEHVEGSTPSRGSGAHRTRTSSPTGSSDPGDPAFFDILHSYMGYRTCYYRTFAVGSASRAQRDAYTICRELMDRAIDSSSRARRPPTSSQCGRPPRSSASPTRRPRSRCSTATASACSIWERPIFSRLTSFDSPETLEEGMVFALETYWPAADGWGAARIEEEVVVTATGCEVITKFPAEELLVAGRRYYTTGGYLPTMRDSQSHLNTVGRRCRHRRQVRA